MRYTIRPSTVAKDITKRAVRSQKMSKLHNLQSDSLQKCPIWYYEVRLSSLSKKSSEKRFKITIWLSLPCNNQRAWMERIEVLWLLQHLLSFDGFFCSGRSFWRAALKVVTLISDGITLDHTDTAVKTPHWSMKHLTAVIK